MTTARQRAYRAIAERVFLVSDNHYSGVYGIEGDCPVEAVLPLSIWPNVAPVSAWPVHQLMSKLVARGLVIKMLHAKDAGRAWTNEPAWARSRY
jgi:hypothetical protein